MEAFNTEENKMKIEQGIMSRREFTKTAVMSCVACGLPAGVASEGSSPFLDRARCMGAMLRMGHCAPTVMHTLIRDDAGDAGYTGLIKLAAGLPGGIGNMGCECGGVTSTLMHLALTPELSEEARNIPLFIHAGRHYMNGFLSMHGSLRCDGINTPDAGMQVCMEAVCSARGLASSVEREAEAALLPVDFCSEYERLLTAFRDASFHCTHSVLSGVPNLIGDDAVIYDAARAFIGGSVLSGLTCGAFTAGVVAIGSAVGEIEDSIPRVLRMMRMMKRGEDALADDVNKFNRAMNTGAMLGEWFVGRFGSTQCRKIVGADLSTPAGVRTYIEKDRMPRCREIADETAGKVREILSGVLEG
jgi:hypothetical protein